MNFSKTPTKYVRNVVEYLIENKKSVLYIFLFFLLPFIAFWRNFDFTGINQTFFNVEFTGFYYPDFDLGSSLFGKFKEMLWDPYNLLGIPLIGGIDRIGLFYPVKFIFYAVSTLFKPEYRLYFITYHSLFHISLAGVFTYLLCRKTLKLSKFASFVSGLVYMFNGSFITFIVLPNHFSGSVFLPFLLYLMHRAVTENKMHFAVIAGLFTAPTLLSGYSPVLLYNGLFIFAFLMLFRFRKPSDLAKIIYYLLISNILAVLLSAVTLLPNMENSSMSDRIQLDMFGTSYFRYFAVNAIYYFFPYFLASGDSPLTYNYGYVGIAPLVLAYIGLRNSPHRRVYFFGLLTVIFFMLSMGSDTFLHSLAYVLVPKYSFFRRPAFIQYLVGFGLAIIGGFGLDKLQKNNEVSLEIKKELRASVLIFVVFFLLLTYKNTVEPTADAARASVFLATLFLIPTLFLLLGPGVKSKLTKTLLVIFIVLDLFSFIYKATRSNSEIDPRIFYAPGELTTWLRENTADHSRVFLNDLTSRYNSASTGLYQVWGYYGLYPQTYGKMIEPFDTDLGKVNTQSPIYDLLGVKYFAQMEELDLTGIVDTSVARVYELEKKDLQKFMTPSGTLLKEGEKIFVYENLDRMPKAFIVNNALYADSDDVASKAIKNIDFRKEVILTTPSKRFNLEVPGSPNEEVSVNEVEVVKYESSEIEIHAKSTKNGILVLSDTYYPGWKVYVDNVEKELLKVNVGLRGVFIKAGEHNVTFVYKPKELFKGMLISGVTTIYIALYLIRHAYITGKGKKE